MKCYRLDLKTKCTKYFRICLIKCKLDYLVLLCLQKLHELTNAFMKNPTKIIVKSEDLTLQGIAQYYINLDDDNMKYECIKDLFSGLSVSSSYNLL